MKQPLVIKVGGALLASHTAKVQLFTTIGQLKAQSIAVVLVHGGGCLVDDWTSDMGLEKKKLDGLRVTPLSQMPIVAGALSGAANKSLVASAKAVNVNAAGISLCDGEMVVCDYVNEALGQVGRCTPKSAELIKILLSGEFTPIISSIADDGNGELMNVNADDAAKVIAQLIKGKLILLSDVPGVLDASKCLIPMLTSKCAEKLVSDGVIAGGMEVKVKAAFETAKSLNDSIIIASWKKPSDLLTFADGGLCGTVINP